MTSPRTEHFLPKEGLPSLLAVLHALGYRVIGPTIDQAAIVYDEIGSVEDLPRGWTEVQEAGTYRLQRRDDDAYFGFTVGPQSPKRFLFPPQATLATAESTETGWQFRTVPDEAPPLALLGVRACDLAAIDVQDRTFLHGPYVDPIYQHRRERALIIAVNCTQAASTCFCTSMNTGPRCTGGFDLALTEIVDGFLIEVGSDRGESVLDQLDTRERTDAEQEAGESARQQAVEQITKRLDTTDIRDLLLENLGHPRWNEVATRCLSCTNCTMVCPTCFCSSVQEVGDLTKDRVERQRVWDSCFNFDFSYMNGGIVRNDIRSRYRQWLTHKLASWHDQFDVSGCVGCGRCITWCPVGIDLTEEVAAIRNSTNGSAESGMPESAPHHVSAVPATSATAARDPWQAVSARIAGIREETPGVSTYELELVEQELADRYDFRPGQFNMLYLPGVGESAISLSGRDEPTGRLLHTVRLAGNVTGALARLGIGGTLGLRGPFGSGWPLEECFGRDIVLVAGGIGLAPLRPVIDTLLSEPDRAGRLTILLGARSPEHLLYEPQYADWQAAGATVATTVDRANSGWRGNVGVVTLLIDRLSLGDPENTLFFLCGPEVMMWYSARSALRLGVPSRNLWLNMERNMNCAIGLCGHCQYGPEFLCKDGPVLPYDRLAPFLKVEDL